MQHVISAPTSLNGLARTGLPPTLQVTPTAIEDVKLLSPKVFADERGNMCETFNQRLFGEHVSGVSFIQDNQSVSRHVGTVRGLHYQAPPFDQAKLVRVAKGEILDVAVDLRRSSPTYGQWVSAVLSAENMCQLFVPAGFAHGFCTTQPDSVVIYKVSARYSPDHEFGVAWNDPTLAIHWPVADHAVKLSAKDGKLPPLAEVASHFE